MPSPPYPHPSSAARAQAPDREEVSFPASFAQQRLWFLHHLAEGVAAYNIPIGLRLRGRLDVDALERALAEVLRRHDVLRTRFVEKGGFPHQIVSPPGPVLLPEEDLRSIPEERRENEAFRIAAAEADMNFDLERGPLIRFRRLRLADQENLILITMHHIVSDGWSVDILLRELAVLYEASTKGEPSPLPELPIQYADYAIWQRDWLRGEILEAQLSYWRKQLAGAPAVVELPTDRIRPATPTFRGGSRSALYSPRLLERLKEVGQKEGVTLFMTLLAGLQALLGRLTEHEDVLVGSPIAGRNQVQTEPLIGFFVNTLVLRGDLSGDPTFRALLRRAREVALQAYAHQDLPFDRLIAEVRPTRELTHNPFLQVMFQVRPSKGRAPRFAGLESGLVNIRTESAKFDLNVTMAPRIDGLHCAMEYSADLFDPETIDRWLKHFEVVLETAAADPDRRISRFPLLVPSEEERLVRDWNTTSSPYPRASSIHREFEARTAQSPAAVAIRYREREMTYAELNSRANQLAHLLRACGVRRGTRVGLCAERSIELPIAMLAILKAGGAYMPLDPSYPQDRLAFMIEDAKTEIVLTQRALGFLPHGLAKTLWIDDSRLVADRPGENLPGESDGGDTAYLMYTSGSTGQPKGVSVPHRGVLRLVLGSRFAELSSREVFLQLAPISFDASTLEIWGALLNGASCVLHSERATSPTELGRLLRSEQVSVLWLTASLFNTVVDTSASLLSGVRQLLIGGEALSVDHVRRAVEALPETRIINGYGPTENTTFSCTYSIPRALPPGLASIPIGRPIENSRVYVLDRHGNPAPVGVPGELYVGGDGLADGYVNRPDLTAASFVPDRFGGEGNRLYRTGDRVRYLPSGEIEFLGRFDDQVKIRGYRIEIGEVESVMRQHPSVRDAVVMAREDDVGDRRLVGYVVWNDEAAAGVAEVRSFMSTKLPEYMIPSVFVRLPALPLNANGKVDRAALPVPGRERPSLGGRAILPRDTLEAVLVKIWEEVLHVWPVGVTDNFFELGGHSLLAVRLFAEIAKRFERNLPLATLFQAPTVERLAMILREKGWKAPSTSLVVIQGAGTRVPFVCVPGVGGNVLGFYDLARYLGPDQPVYGLQARGLDGTEEPQTRVEDMAAHYIQEIKALLPSGPFLLGGASFGGNVAYEMARQLQTDSQWVALVCLFDTFAPRSGASSDRLARWRRRLRNQTGRFVFHARNIIQGPDRLLYVQRKTQTLRRRWRSRLWRLLYRSYEGMARPLPAELQDVREAGYLANKRYVPGLYPGTVTLFRAGVRSFGESRDYEMGWGKLAQGGVEVEEIPGDHVNMLIEPHVRVLARKLRDCIDRALAQGPGQRQTAS